LGTAAGAASARRLTNLRRAGLPAPLPWQQGHEASGRCGAPRRRSVMRQARLGTARPALRKGGRWEPSTRTTSHDNERVRTGAWRSCQLADWSAQRWTPWQVSTDQKGWGSNPSERAQVNGVAGLGKPRPRR